jgi:hypothetical protein
MYLVALCLACIIAGIASVFIGIGIGCLLVGWPSRQEKGTHCTKGASDEQTHAISIAQKRGGCTALAHVRPQLSDDRMDQLRTDRRMR